VEFSGFSHAADSRVLMSTMRVEVRPPMFGKHLAEGQVKCRWAWDGGYYSSTCVSGPLLRMAYPSSLRCSDLQGLAQLNCSKAPAWAYKHLELGPG